MNHLSVRSTVNSVNYAEIQAYIIHLEWLSSSSHKHAKLDAFLHSVTFVCLKELK